MNVYYNYNNKPIKFSGSAVQCEKFLRQNAHLEGCEVQKPEYDALKRDKDNRGISEARRRAIIDEASLDDQLAMIFDAFGFLELNGIDIPTAISSFNGKRKYIRQQHPYID